MFWTGFSERKGPCFALPSSVVRRLSSIPSDQWTKNKKTTQEAKVCVEIGVTTTDNQLFTIRP
jgi:hypothetical protein